MVNNNEWQGLIFDEQQISNQMCWCNSVRCLCCDQRMPCHCWLSFYWVGKDYRSTHPRF